MAIVELFRWQNQIIQTWLNIDKHNNSWSVCSYGLRSCFLSIAKYAMVTDRVKSCKFWRSATFGLRACLFHILIIGIKNKLTKQTVKLLMRGLTWISIVCKCMSEFTWCLKLHDFTLLVSLDHHPTWALQWFSYWPFQGVSFVDPFCLLSLSYCVVCSLQPWGHLLGKGWPLEGLTSLLSCVLCFRVFVAFQWYDLGRVWYLIVLIP